LDLTGPASQVAERWRKWKRAFECYAEGKGIENVRKKYKTYSKIYKILVLSQRRATTLTRSLFASWISTFASRKIFLTSAMFFVS